MKTENRLGVLHMISGLEFGGAEKMLLWAARHHNRKMIRLGVVSLMSGGTLAQDIRGEDVEVLEFGQRRGWLSPGAFFKLVKAARSFNPRFIQGHLFHSNILARLIALFVPGARALTTRHNETDSITRVLLYALTSFLNAGTIVFSDAVMEHVKQDNLAGRPLRLVPSRARTSITTCPISIRSPTESACESITAPLTIVGFDAVGICVIEAPEAPRRIHACWREILPSARWITLTSPDFVLPRPIRTSWPSSVN